MIPVVMSAALCMGSILEREVCAVPVRQLSSGDTDQFRVEQGNLLDAPYALPYRHHGKI